MAERLKVFQNKTFTAADIVNDDEFTLIANDATTQAVVKSIEVTPDVVPLDDEGRAVSLSLFNGEMPIGQMKTAEGLEIVDTGATLKVKLGKVPGLTVDYAHNTEGFQSYWKNGGLATRVAGKDPITITPQNYAMKEGFSNADKLQLVQETFGQAARPDNYNFDSTTETPVDSYSTNNHRWLWYGETYAYAFYTDSNSVQQINRWALDENGQITGSMTNALARSYAPMGLDLENGIVYYYENSGNTVEKLDLNTGVFSQVSSGSYGSNCSSFTVGAYCNGYFFWVQSSANNGEIQFCNVSTGACGKLVAAGQVSNYPRLLVAYNPVEDEWVFMIGYDSNGQIFYLTGAITDNATPTLLGSFPTLLGSPHSVSNSCSYFAPVWGKTDEFYATKATGNIPMRMKYANRQFTVLEERSEIILATARSNFLERPLAAQVSSPADIKWLEINLQCKIAGVEITEVT